jgi:hypothetical protein
MKKILLICALLFNLVSIAQEDKTVTLTVSGSGKTLEESKTNALRSAIEQAFGAFISSKTEILNDAVVKDEIISVANGNIQKYEVISELQLPDGGYNTSLKATVSVTKLTTFAESKGVAVEFKGGLFAANILMQELYEKNEVRAIKNLLNTLQEISTNSFDYSISAGEAVSVENNKWSIPLLVDVKANKNFQNFPLLLEQTLAGLSLSEDEVNKYKKLNKPIYSIILATFEKDGVYNLRNEESVKSVIEFIYSLNHVISNVRVANDIRQTPISQYDANNWNNFVNDKNFRVFLIYTGSDCPHYAGVFNNNYYGGDSYKWTNHLNHKIVFSRRWGDGFTDNHFIFRKILGYPEKICNNLEKFNLQLKHFPQGYEFNHHEKEHIFYLLSFAHINLQNSLVQFNFNDILSLEEIKQLTKYEIIKN